MWGSYDAECGGVVPCSLVDMLIGSFKDTVTKTLIKNFILTSVRMWHVSSNRWYTSDLCVVTIDTSAFVPQWHQGLCPNTETSVSSVHSQEGTACFMLTSVANCLLARCCVRGPKRKSLCPTLPTRLVTCYRTTTVKLRTAVPPVSLCCAQWFSILQRHMASKQFAVDTTVKQAITSWPQSLDMPF
jgi:hypothetical protein